MTTKAKDPTVARRCPSPVVLFGIDSRGKPKGSTVRKGARQPGHEGRKPVAASSLAGNDPKVAEIAARLPVGRVHATGRTFVPFIRRDLYDKLVAAAANGNAHPASPPNGSSGRCRVRTARRFVAPPAQVLAEIGLGDLVVAQEGPEDGWYEAIVAEANGDMLTVTLARLSAGTASRTPSATARIAIPGSESDGRDREISESIPGKRR